VKLCVLTLYIEFVPHGIVSVLYCLMGFFDSSKRTLSNSDFLKHSFGYMRRVYTNLVVKGLESNSDSACHLADRNNFCFKHYVCSIYTHQQQSCWRLGLDTCCEFCLSSFAGWYDGPGRCDVWLISTTLFGPKSPGLSTVSYPIVVW
jgi:hypothetical protein